MQLKLNYLKMTSFHFIICMLKMIKQTTDVVMKCSNVVICKYCRFSNELVRFLTNKKCYFTIEFNEGASIDANTNPECTIQIMIT